MFTIVTVAVVLLRGDSGSEDMRSGQTQGQTQGLHR